MIQIASHHMSGPFLMDVLAVIAVGLGFAVLIAMPLVLIGLLAGDDYDEQEQDVSIPYNVLTDMDAELSDRLAKADSSVCQCRARIAVCDPDCLCDCHREEVENYHDAE